MLKKVNTYHQSLIQPDCIAFLELILINALPLEEEKIRDNITVIDYDFENPIHQSIYIDLALTNDQHLLIQLNWKE